MGRLIRFFSLLMIVALAGCSSLAGRQPVEEIAKPVDVPAANTNSPTPAAVEHDLNVFAAASLTGAFMEIGREFEAAHPGVKVNFNFAGSQILRMQIEQGAQADVFASADHKNMERLVAENLVNQGTRDDFATNKLIVILPAGNPADLKSLSDLAKIGVKIVLADESVPAGNYARQVLAKMNLNSVYGTGYSDKVMANIVSNETDVKQVVAKVELGEADAGIVYISDAIAAPDLRTISIPDQFNVIASYPMAVLKNSSHADLARAFTVYVLSPAGQSILSRWGFEAAH